MKRFYQIESAGRIADVHIFGDIVTPDEKWWREFWGDNSPVSGLSLVSDIKALDVDTINVHINSYGGAVSEGMAIYNALKQHPAKVITYNDGFCASAAVMPFLAGDERIASSCSAFLFHQVMTSFDGGYGNEADVDKAIEALAQIKDDLKALTDLTMGPYMAHATIAEDEMRAIFQKGGWLTPEKVQEIGLVTSIEAYKQENKPAASAKGAFFAQFFKPEQTVPTTVDVRITDLPEFKTLVEQVKALAAERQEEAPPAESKTIKFLNALMTGRKD